MWTEEQPDSRALSVAAVRRAERFIYIENQYFMGGSHLWDSTSAGDRSACRNLVAAEIALKVAAKIRAGERFGAYVVVPMWPEGAPESETVGEMLHWFRQTVAMMYGIVGEAIEETGGTGSPSEYLSFFCLGNREVRRAGEHVAPELPRRGTQYWNAQRNRRFMVYVHSKLIIGIYIYICFLICYMCVCVFF